MKMEYLKWFMIIAICSLRQIESKDIMDMSKDYEFLQHAASKNLAIMNEMGTTEYFEKMRKNIIETIEIRIDIWRKLISAKIDVLKKDTINLDVGTIQCMKNGDDDIRRLLNIVSEETKDCALEIIDEILERREDMVMMMQFYNDIVKTYTQQAYDCEKIACIKEVNEDVSELLDELVPRIKEKSNRIHAIGIINTSDFMQCFKDSELILNKKAQEIYADLKECMATPF